MTQEEKLLVSAYTGYCMVDISELQKFAEKTLDRPIMTHEFADKAVWEELQEKLKPDFIKLCEREIPQVQQDELGIKNKLCLLMRPCLEELCKTIYANINQSVEDMELDFFEFACLTTHDTECFIKLNNFLQQNDILTDSTVFSEGFNLAKQAYLKDRSMQNQFNLNAHVIDDDGFKGKIIAYHPEANMYKVEHDLVDGKLPVADGWYPPERLSQCEPEKIKLIVDERFKDVRVCDLPLDVKEALNIDGVIWQALERQELPDISFSREMDKALIGKVRDLEHILTVEYVNMEKTQDIDSLISRATVISEQSKGLAEDLGKLKDNYEKSEPQL